MSDFIDEKIIEFSAKRKTNPSSKKEESEKRKKQIEANAKATTVALEGADAIAVALRETSHKSLRFEDRFQMARNLGAMSVDLFGSEADAKRNMVDIFQTAFGSLYVSDYKKRTRFILFPSEETGADPEKTTLSAAGWKYADLAVAIGSKRDDPEKRQRQSILRLIRGTSFDSSNTALARARGRSEREFIDQIEAATSLLRPLLNDLLDAAAEAGGRDADYLAGVNGVECSYGLPGTWPHVWPRVKIATVSQRYPVLFSKPTGLDAEELFQDWKLFLEEPSAVEGLVEEKQSQEMTAWFLENISIIEHALTDDDAMPVVKRVFRSTIAAVAVGNIFVCQKILSKIGYPIDGDLSQDVDAMLDFMGRDYLRMLEDVAVTRWKIKRDFPELANTSNEQLIDEFNKLCAEERNTIPTPDKSDGNLTQAEILDLLVDLATREEMTTCFEQLFAEEQACFRCNRDLVLIPLLDETTGDWHLAMGIDGEDKVLDQPITPVFRNLNSEENPSDDTGKKVAFPDAYYDARLRFSSTPSPIFSGTREFEGFSNMGAVAWLVDDATNEVHLAFLFDLDDVLWSGTFGEPPEYLSRPIGSLESGWINYLAGKDEIGVLFSNIMNSDLVPHGELKPEVEPPSKGHLGLPRGSLASAIIEDFSQGREESIIFSKLTKSILDKTEEFRKMRKESDQAYRDKLSWLTPSGG